MISNNSLYHGQSGCGADAALRLLVVDAECETAEMIRASFAHEGCLVDSCLTGDEVFNFELADYDLILLDLTIDDNSGLGIVEQIKQLYESDEVAIIAYSTVMSPEQIIKALNAGADDYLIKPFSLRELKARVRSVLRRR